ncbi:hypothetical protein [Moheibacter stercoris]|uniref:Uncharacterized protein YcfL n=1 Tax=Moheibacter stercoris TaxID=1628251 RepID=A0ABV2LU56_9FLAO
MKKYLLALLLLFLSVQCASNKNSERARIEKEYKIPKFSNDSAQDLAYNLAVMIDDLKKSIENGEEITKNTIQSKVMNFISENKSKGEFMSLEDTKKMTNWTMDLLKEFIDLD